jgi:hypothetical protein
MRPHFSQRSAGGHGQQGIQRQGLVPEYQDQTGGQPEQTRRGTGPGGEAGASGGRGGKASSGFRYPFPAIALCPGETAAAAASNSRHICRSNVRSKSRAQTEESSSHERFHRACGEDSSSGCGRRPVHGAARCDCAQTQDLSYQYQSVFPRNPATCDRRRQTANSPSSTHDPALP